MTPRSCAQFSMTWLLRVVTPSSTKRRSPCFSPSVRSASSRSRTCPGPRLTFLLTWSGPSARCSRGSWRSTGVYPSRDREGAGSTPLADHLCERQILHPVHKILRLAHLGEKFQVPNTLTNRDL